jgi:hypothetical protein
MGPWTTVRPGSDMICASIILPRGLYSRGSVCGR